MYLNPMLAFYALPLLLVWTVYIGRRRRAEARSIARRAAAAEADLLEPSSLHPEIDPARCIGCGACVRACPEGDILGLINRKAILVEPSECIGHGARRLACPSDAINLVFGTARRGVDIPHAAASIAEEAGTTVTLSHRSEGFSRAKLKNRDGVAAAQRSGRLTVLMQSEVKRIRSHDVELAQGGDRMVIKNDAVILCAGGILPTPFLKAIGIEVETKYGTA